MKGGENKLRARKGADQRGRKSVQCHPAPPPLSTPLLSNQKLFIICIHIKYILGVRILGFAYFLHLIRPNNLTDNVINNVKG